MCSLCDGRTETEGQAPIGHWCSARAGPLSGTARAVASYRSVSFPILPDLANTQSPLSLSLLSLSFPHLFHFTFPSSSAPSPFIYFSSSLFYFSFSLFLASLVVAPGGQNFSIRIRPSPLYSRGFDGNYSFSISFLLDPLCCVICVT